MWMPGQYGGQKKKSRKIIGDEPCPTCRKNGRDRTGNHLMIFEDGTKYCNRCGHLEKPSKNKKRKEDLVMDDLPDLDFGDKPDYQEVAVPPHQAWRGINREVLEKYRCLFVNGPGNVYEEFVWQGHDLKGQPVGWKIRYIENKKFECTWKKGTKVQLFGQPIFPANGKRVLITEGEIDAMSMYQALAKYKIPCLSVPNGTGNGKGAEVIRDNFEYLSSFEEIYFCPDRDEEGEKLLEKVATMFPNLKEVVLPYKDPNEMLLEEGEEALAKCFWNAKTYSPPFMRDFNEILADMVKEPEPGLPTPWENVDEMISGISPGIYSIGAAPGVGKTLFMQALLIHLMFEHNKKVCHLDLENGTADSLRQLVGYILNIPRADRDKFATNEAIEVAKTFEGRWLSYESTYFNGSWQRLTESFRFYLGKGAEVFIIDPLTYLVAGMPSTEANDIISGIYKDLTDMVKAFNVTVFVVNHLNNSKGKIPHEAGGMPLPGEFTGSRSQWRFSHYMLGLARPTLPWFSPARRNILTVGCLKHRDSGHFVGETAHLQYVPETGRLVPFLGDPGELDYDEETKEAIKEGRSVDFSEKGEEIDLNEIPF